MCRPFFIVSFFLINMFFSKNVLSQTGPVPVNPPIGGFAIDGFLQRQGAAGDWLQGAPPNNGLGTYVLSDIGVPLLTYTYRIIDLWNDNNDNILSSASFNGNPNSFQWILKKPHSTGDINNVLFNLSNDASGNVWAILAADKMKSDYFGNSTLYDFEFLQNPLFTVYEPPSNTNQNQGTGRVISYGPHGGRTVGDVVVSIDFGGGGTLLEINTYVWKPDPNGGYSYQLAFAPAIAASNATAPISVPYGAFGSNVYKQSTFAEMALNMTYATGGITCLNLENTFRTIWVKSKRRSGNGYKFDDFITPVQLNVSNDYSLTYEVNFFDLFKAQLTANVTPGTIDDYNFHWEATGVFENGIINPAITGSLNDYNIYNPILSVDPDLACATYLYQVTIARKDNPGCIVARTPVIITNYCKIGKPINPDRANLKRNEAREVINNSKEIFVYPNPSNGNATVILPNNGRARDIELLDIKGSVVQRWKTVTGNTIQFKNVQPGLYLLRVLSEDGKTATKKILIH